MFGGNMNKTIFVMIVSYLGFLLFPQGSQNGMVCLFISVVSFLWFTSISLCNYLDSQNNEFNH